MSSRVCCKRWQERSYMLHRKKLSDIKPSIDNKTPQMYPHLYQKLKKAQKDEELCSVIERDNRTLVKRMTEIMQRPGIDTHNTIQPKSLNREARKRELLRITQENQKLLRRIQARQPTYNHLAWEQERERSEILCERICRYPYRPRTTAEKNLYYYESPTATAGAAGTAGSAPPIDMNRSPNQTQNSTLQSTNPNLNNTVTSQGSSYAGDTQQAPAALPPAVQAAEQPPPSAGGRSAATASEDAGEETAAAATTPVAEEKPPAAEPLSPAPETTQDDASDGPGTEHEEEEEEEEEEE